MTKLPTDDTNQTTADQKKLRPQRKALKLERAYDPSSSDFLESVQRQLINSYKTSTYEGKTEFNAVVLKNVYVGTVAAAANDYEVRVRARVDELHSHLPKPKQGDECSIIDLYPEFIAESEEELGGQPMPGEIIRVKFIDRHQTSLKYSNGVILQRGLGSKEVFSGIKDSPLLKFVKCRETKKKPGVKPPEGDKLDGGNEAPEGGARPGGANGPGGNTPGEQPESEGGAPEWSLPGDPAPGTEGPVASTDPQDVLERERARKKSEAEIKCDKEYLLGLVREKIDRPAQIESPQELLDKIKELVPWGTADNGGLDTIEKIAKLHPLIRLKVAERFNELSEEYGIKLVITGKKPYRTTAESRRIARQNNKWAKTNEGGSWHNYGFAFDCVEHFDKSAYYLTARLKFRNSPAGQIPGAVFKPPAKEFMSHGPDGKWKDSPVVRLFKRASFPFEWGGDWDPRVFGRGGDWIHFDARHILRPYGITQLDQVKEMVIISENVDEEGYIKLTNIPPAKE